MLLPLLQKKISEPGKTGRWPVDKYCRLLHNTAGLFIPPMLIFQRARIYEQMSRGAPPGSIIKCSPFG